MYRQFSLTFDVLSYNSNTVTRKGKVTATAIGGSVFVLVTSCLSGRYKDAARDLAAIQQSFRVNAVSRAREAEIDAKALSSADQPEDEDFGKSDVANSRTLEEAVGIASEGRIGFRHEK